ncbi:MAG: molybdopterin molybdotransferase MoeA [Anaerolineae bacterium]
MMIGYEDALAATLAALEPLQPPEMAPLWELTGRVTAQDLFAQDDAPTADVSLKDGYAVRSADVAQAAPDHPVPLRLVGQVSAGEIYAGEVGQGMTVRILSGALLPAGTDAVLAEEFAQRTGEIILALADAAAGRNVARRGSELAAGQRILPAGTVLRPAQVGLLAAAGYNEVPVVRRPRVGIVATGDEVVGLPDRTKRLKAGQVFASNLATIAAWCTHYGIPTSGIMAADNPAALTTALLDALAKNDAVITSGGAWSGEHDLVAGTLDRLGWRKIYHRVRLGPGKGAGFGLWQGKPVFILPGGPASNQMAFLQLALPGLHRLMGRHPSGLPVCPARLAAAISGQRDWTQFVEGRFEWRNRELWIVPAQGPSRLRSMASCEGYIKIPEGTETLEAGAQVLVQVLPDVPARQPTRPTPEQVGRANAIAM